MSLDIILGAQWGDEGKGRITDLMAREADYVARFSGGDNAGHTVSVGDETFKLHLIPSGIIHDGVICVIGNGVVINPAVFLREIDGLAKRGVDVSSGRLKISRQAHLITPAHIALDKASEAALGKGAIGTTQRGIGPAYVDKVGRAGLRAGLLAEPEALADAIQEHVDAKNKQLTNFYGCEALDAAAIATQFAAYAQRLAPYLADVTTLLGEALDNGRVVLAEGAQGTMLDIDHGTYPFVTSSSPTAGGVLTGLGLGPKVVNRVMGVAKAFSSRVGGGPFVTELDGDEALRLRGTGANPWDEYGTTTGRPRRVGWLDAVILRHAVRINSLTDLALTKLDILSGLPQIPVCVAYELDGQEITAIPAELEKLERCQPIYEVLPGWEEDVTAARTLEDLPANAVHYVNFVARITKTPVTMISVGPERDQVIQNTAARL